MIRKAVSDETSSLVDLALRTGLFSPEDADLLLRSTLDQIHDGTLGEEHFAFVFESEGRADGWVYFSDNPRANGVWDLWWIGVDPERHGRGVGRQLMAFVEGFARARGARLLQVETSDTDALEATRSFYVRLGYTRCGVVPDYYSEGDGKVTFVRRLAG
jgi:ribosomal protein S18 acetylase RimI-like enzyme